MPFEPITILTSAIVGGAAGVLMSSWKVHTEESAKRRVAARQTIRKEATRLSVYLAAGREEAILPDDFDPTSKQGSIDWTATILEAAYDLAYIRRRLVLRRLRRIVGHETILRADAQVLVSDAAVLPGVQRVTLPMVILESLFPARKRIGVIHRDHNVDVPGGILKVAIDTSVHGEGIYVFDELSRLRNFH